MANDQQAKRLFHNTLTGKLSDIAACFVLPLLVSAALGLVNDWPGRRRLALGAIVATLVFTLLELSDTAGALFVRATGALGLGGVSLTRDPTDLLALACVPLALAYGRRRLAVAESGQSIWRSATGALVMATGSLALMATTYSAHPEPCHESPVPVMFQAGAGCGPGGLIVVGPNTTDSALTAGLKISNAAALGLPSFTSSDSGSWSSGSLPASRLPDGGVACPSRLDQGGWEVTVFGCLSGDGAASDCSLGHSATLQTCRADLVDGVSMFTCFPNDGGAQCVSRLTVVSP